MAALARVVVNYIAIVTSPEGVRQTSAAGKLWNSGGERRGCNLQ
jgi:hypothetical protein